jgi:hypothetical protein
MFRVWSYHGLNQCWMYMARCIKLNAKFVPRYKTRKSCWPLNWIVFGKTLGKWRCYLQSQEFVKLLNITWIRNFSMLKMNVCIVQSGRTSLLTKSTMLLLVKGKKNLVQFFVCFHMFAKGKPMIDYVSMNKLLHFLDVKEFPKTHWSNIIG